MNTEELKTVITINKISNKTKVSTLGVKMPNNKTERVRVINL